MDTVLIIYILAGMIVVSAGSGLFINSLINLAKSLKVNSFIITLFAVGFAATLPEFMIAISSVVNKLPEIAFANAIGSSIIGMSFVIGMVAMFSKKINTKHFFEIQDISYFSMTALILVFVVVDGYISRIDGIILMLTFSFYLWEIYKKKDLFSIKYSRVTKNSFIYLLVMLLASFGVYLAADFTVFNIAKLSNLTLIPIFLLVVSLVSPLGAVPEVLYELSLISEGKSKLSLGDLFTSMLTNLTFIIGFIALISPFAITISNYIILSFIALIVLIIIFNFFAHSKNSIDKKEGGILILLYLLYLLSMILI
jgi:cation:H+ antiporter